MHIPTDLEYIVHRPGNPRTHSLGNGCGPGPAAAENMAHLAREWLQESPFVGIEITRFKILIVICKDPMTGVPTLKDFNKRDTDQFMGHDVIYKGMEYLEELDALPKREKAASQKNEPSVK